MRGLNLDASAYTASLEHWTQRLAAGRGDATPAEIAAGEAADVQRFLLNTIEERRRMLNEELRLVALAFDDFASLVARYLAEVPRVTFDVDYSDSQRFLRWLRGAQPLGPRQRDFVACQEAEYACLALARNCRRAHLEFQRRWRACAARADRLAADGPTLVYVNPVRVWSRLAALGPAHEEGVAAVFFAAGPQIRVAGLAGVRAEWLRALSAAEPCPLCAWAGRCSGAAHRELAGLARELSEAGLLALASPGEEIHVTAAVP